ncbi:MAG: amidohydrolase family protein [Chloroflexota bacterium]|nr:amidohydrolase family protein [Chloroflexota bacterium]
MPETDCHRANTRWQLPCYLAPAIDMHAHPPYDRCQTEPMLEAARRVGVERLILCSIGHSDMIPYPPVGEVRQGNDEVFDLIDRHPGFVFGLVYVNPNHPETLTILEEGFQHSGVVGIKLWISCRDEYGRLDPVYPVFEFAAARRVPVLCHSFYRTGGNLPGELSPSDISHLATRYPAARLVMAHMGGQWLRGVRAIKPYPNVWTDFSGGRAYMGSLEFAVRELGADRVVYGSDAFIRAFAPMLAKVAAAELDLAAKRQIVWDNSAALFFSGKSK